MMVASTPKPVEQVGKDAKKKIANQAIRLKSLGPVVDELQNSRDEYNKAAQAVLDNREDKARVAALENLQKQIAAKVKALWDFLPDPMPAFQKGSSGPQVKLAKMLLNELGWGTLPENETVDDKTDGAIRDYQQANGLGVDGATGPNTWAALMAGKKGKGPSEAWKTGAAGASAAAAGSSFAPDKIEIPLPGSNKITIDAKNKKGSFQVPGLGSRTLWKATDKKFEVSAKADFSVPVYPPISANFGIEGKAFAKAPEVSFTGIKATVDVGKKEVSLAGDVKASMSAGLSAAAHVAAQLGGFIASVKAGLKGELTLEAKAEAKAGLEMKYNYEKGGKPVFSAPYSAKAEAPLKAKLKLFSEVELLTKTIAKAEWKIAEKELAKMSLGSVSGKLSSDGDPTINLKPPEFSSVLGAIKKSVGQIFADEKDTVDDHERAKMPPNSAPESDGSYMYDVPGPTTPIWYRHTGGGSWQWTPDEDTSTSNTGSRRWMGTKFLAVQGSGEWRGKTPHATNVKLIKWLEDRTPTP